MIGYACGTAITRAKLTKEDTEQAVKETKSGLRKAMNNMLMRRMRGEQ